MRDDTSQHSHRLAATQPVQPIATTTWSPRIAALHRAWLTGAGRAGKVVVVRVGQTRMKCESTAHRSRPFTNASAPACSGLLRPAPACSGLLRPAPACSGLLRPAPACSGLLRPAPACSGLLRPQNKRPVSSDGPPSHTPHSFAIRAADDVAAPFAIPPVAPRSRNTALAAPSPHFGRDDYKDHTRRPKSSAKEHGQRDAVPLPNTRRSTL